MIGCRSGYKDENGKCVMENLPGILSGLTGTDITEYSLIAPDTGCVTIDWDGTELEASIFAELLEPINGGVTEGVYTADYFAGYGVLISKQFGKGKVYYYGSAWNEKSAEIFLKKLGVCTPYSELVEVPESCEIAIRRKGESRFLFVLNYDKNSVRFTLKEKGVHLYTGENVEGEIPLEGYGTAVIKL